MERRKSKVPQMLESKSSSIWLKSWSLLTSYRTNSLSSIATSVWPRISVAPRIAQISIMTMKRSMQ